MLALRFGNARELLVAFPQVEKQTKRHKPHLIKGKMEVGYAIIEKSSK